MLAVVVSDVEIESEYQFRDSHARWTDSHSRCEVKACS
jgi:hypothetical protein